MSVTESAFIIRYILFNYQIDQFSATILLM